MFLSSSNRLLKRKLAKAGKTPLCLEDTLLHVVTFTKMYINWFKWNILWSISPKIRFHIKWSVQFLSTKLNWRYLETKRKRKSRHIMGLFWRLGNSLSIFFFLLQTIWLSQTAVRKQILDAPLLFTYKWHEGMKRPCAAGESTSKEIKALWVWRNAERKWRRKLGWKMQMGKPANP